MIDGSITGHVWSDDGHDDEGARVSRCERCAVRSHWPAAESKCALYADRARPLVLRCPPLHAGQWQPPYVPIAPRRCCICSRAYRVPLRGMTTTCCSRPCALVRKASNERARARARNRATA